MNAANSTVGAEMLEAEVSSMAIVIAGDCGGGIGLPALYRAKIGLSNLP
jgi:hypothetical protein